ncbi:HupE/UreJ family protein [Pontiellaceae bacterium B12219]|nr:HupE/UreJ family protein [Pontiellaceae bacterium B12219]
MIFRLNSQDSTVGRVNRSASISGGLILVLFFSGFQSLEAHEMNTAYLELREQPEEVSVLVRIPEFGNPFTLQFPEGTVRQTEPVTRIIDGGTVKTWRARLPGGLVDQQIGVEGLALNELLVRVELLDGSGQTLRLSPEDRSFMITGAPSQLAVAGTYFVLGVEHILMGFDHLLFVFSLILLIHSTKKLIGAITMFTVAHSITLALAALGFVHVPSASVEALIALSIVFVAVEIIHGQQGFPGITAKAPWLMTLAFGLLHGLGFAGALSEVGLPQHAIPAALLFFNVGVEAGQLLFVGAVLAILWLLRRLPFPRVGWSPWLSAYAIGSIAMFWVFERVAGF